MNNIDSERLAQMRGILQWASDNVATAYKSTATNDIPWRCYIGRPSSEHTGHTLYECLLNAWVDAHPKK